MTFSLPHTCSVVACAWTYSRQHSKREQCSYKANIYSATTPFINVFISLPLRFHEVAHELGVEDRITMAIAGIRSIH